MGKLVIRIENDNEELIRPYLNIPPKYFDNLYIIFTKYNDKQQQVSEGS